MDDTEGEDNDEDVWAEFLALESQYQRTNRWLAEEVSMNKFLTDFGCPDCGQHLAQWEMDCPGYPHGDSIMVCHPPSHCGNAFLLTCDGGCGWELRVPENRRKDAHGTIPDWLPAFLAEFQEDDTDAG